MRNQDEILKRTNEVIDFYRIQKSTLINYLSYENAKIYLKKTKRDMIENGDISWEQLTKPEEEIREIISQTKSTELSILLKIRALTWLTGDFVYNEVIETIDDWPKDLTELFSELNCLLEAQTIKS